MSSSAVNSSNSEINLSNFPPESFLGTLIASFPTEWQGFFGALNATTPKSVQNACCWFNEKQHSSRNYEDISPNITILFEHLTRDFPIVFENNLYFKPKILLLPLHLQRNLMSFILSKSDVIPVESLKKLDAKLKDFKDEVEGWITTLNKLLKIKIKDLEREYENKDIKLLEKGKEVFYVDIITDQSKDRFLGLCQQINENPCSSNKIIITSKVKWKSLEYDANVEVKETVKDLLCSGVSQTIPIGTCDGTSGVDLEIREATRDIEQQVEIMDLDIGNLQTDFLTHKTAENQMNSSEIPSKKAKLEEEMDENRSSQFVIPQPPGEFDVVDDQPSATVNDLQIKLEPLCNLIQALESSEVVKTTTSTVAINIFCELSSSEIEKACDIVNMESLNEQSVASLCQYFVALESEPSYMNACAFASYCILPRLQKLEQTASRVLTGAVTSFSKKHPKAICDGLFIKLLTETTFSSFQADLISKTLKDMQNQDTSKHLFSLLLKATNVNKCHLSEDKVLVVQTIIDFKLELDNDLFRDYITALQDNSVAMAKSLKFAKLLLATINNYSTLVALHKESIENILQRNETFLKKAGLASLRKTLAKVQI